MPMVEDGSFSAPSSSTESPRTQANSSNNNPTLDPYIGKLERYELFCTNQSYYLVGCNKQNSQYRILKMGECVSELASRPDPSLSIYFVPRRRDGFIKSSVVGGDLFVPRIIITIATKMFPRMNPCRVLSNHHHRGAN